MTGRRQIIDKQCLSRVEHGVFRFHGMVRAVLEAADGESPQ